MVQKDEVYQKLTSGEQLQLWEQGLCPGEKVCNLHAKGYQMLSKHQRSPMQQSSEALLMRTYVMKHVVK